MLLFIFIRTSPYFSSLSSRIQDPYVLEVLVLSTTLLIAFRANYGYERYWDACGDSFQMMSYWLDAVANAGIFHMQQKHHDCFKPPSYFDHHDLNRLGLRRDRQQDDKSKEGDRDIPCTTANNTNARMGIESMFPISKANADFPFAQSNDTIKAASINQRQNPKGKPSSRMPSVLKEGDQESLHLLQQQQQHHQHQQQNHRHNKSTMGDPKYLVQKGRLDGGWGAQFPDGKSTYHNMNDPNLDWSQHVKTDPRGFASNAGGRTPNLYLQELVHLASLCNAVALATLRDDIEGTKIPLTRYLPGEAWPEVDPSKLITPRTLVEIIKDAIYAITSYDCTPEMQTEHNISRPIPVLGGISDSEYMFLTMARGPSAKVLLAWNWLSEFITREDLEGSFGKVGAPLVSRIHQFLSDGMIHYNHCRKTMFTPFPFPHAQISALFVMIVLFIVPLLMDEYMNHDAIGALITFLTVTCLAGLHEVARDLENPFRNVPNEIPLLSLQAIFNEGLVTLFAGFHPDHYWNADDFWDSTTTIRCENDNNTSMLNPYCSNESEEDVASEIEDSCEDYERMMKLMEQQQMKLDRIYSLLKVGQSDNELLTTKDLSDESVLAMDRENVEQCDDGIPDRHYDVASN